MADWEISITIAFLGSAIILIYLANSLKERWFIPAKIIFFLFALGMVLQGLGVQRNILDEKLINNTKIIEATSSTIQFGTYSFFIIVLISIILGSLSLIQYLLIKKKGKDPYKEIYGKE